jgi:hypothetical protein
LGEGENRKIAGGPLYPAQEVLALLTREQERAIVLWTRKCKSDVQKYELNLDELYVFLAEALRNGSYRGSEWCVQCPNGPWAACDVYSLVRNEWIKNAHKFMKMEYYLKFAVARSGQLLLLVSCHLSEDR